MIAVLLCKLFHISGDVFLAHVLAELVVEDIGLHLDEIDHAAEGIFASDGQLDGNGVTLESLVHHLQDIEEIGTHHVHLVHVNKARDMVLVGLSPYSLGLRLDAALCTKDGHGAVKHAERTLDLYSEVDVARRVDEVQYIGFAVVRAVVQTHGARLDGDAALALKVVVVEHEVARLLVVPEQVSGQKHFVN